MTLLFDILSFPCLYWIRCFQQSCITFLGILIKRSLIGFTFRSLQFSFSPSSGQYCPSYTSPFIFTISCCNTLSYDDTFKISWTVIVKQPGFYPLQMNLTPFSLETLEVLFHNKKCYFILRVWTLKFFSKDFHKATYIRDESY